MLSIVFTLSCKTFRLCGKFFLVFAFFALIRVIRGFFLLPLQITPIKKIPLHHRYTVKGYLQNFINGCFGYLFTWKVVSPSFIKPIICRIAATPAFKLASAVWAPIFFGVKKTRPGNFSSSSGALSGLISER